MDTDDLALFADVARRGNFAAVARAQDCDPSAVSRAVAALEDRLGVRLFQRSTRRVVLTEAGERFLARVEPLLADLAQAQEEAREINARPAGTVRITASVSLGQTLLVPVVTQARRQFPDLRLELLLTDTNLDLVAERIDLAVRLGPGVSGDVVAARLFDTRYRVVASPRYAAAGTPPLAAPQDLAAHRCLLFALPEFRVRWRFRDAAGTVTEVPVSGDVVISNAIALRDCAIAGLGPALLADWLTEDARRGGALVDLFPHHRATATDFDTGAWLLYPSRAFLPHRTRAVADVIRQRLGRGAQTS